MFWFAILFVAAFAIAYATMPKYDNNAKVGTFEAPTAEVGRLMPVLFGTRDTAASNVVWYGDIVTEAVKA
jgi:hypothetical protein